MIKLNFKIDLTSRPVIIVSFTIITLVGLIMILFASNYLYENFFHTSAQIQDMLDKRDKFSIESINKSRLDVIENYLTKKNTKVQAVEGRNPFMKK